MHQRQSASLSHKEMFFDVAAPPSPAEEAARKGDSREREKTETAASRVSAASPF